MKQVKVKFPANRADELASKAYELECITIFSWSEDGWLTSSVYAVIAVPDSKLEEFKKSFGKFITS
jgi:hypothetical protein